jgi:hypothetical protein
LKTEKKNQHYIPKFYLRAFSYQNNGKQIGIYNQPNQFFFPTAKLKTQGSKNFFYGEDGRIEEGLSKIEGLLSATLGNIIQNQRIPVHGSEEHGSLLFFIALTHMRNPIAIESVKNSQIQLAKRMLENYPDADVDSIVPKVSHEQALHTSLSMIQEITPPLKIFLSNY